jgi:hypothetical protein
VNITASGLLEPVGVPRDCKETTIGEELHTNEGDLDIGQH